MGYETLVARTRNRTFQGTKIIVLIHREKCWFCTTVKWQNDDENLKNYQSKSKGEKLGGRLILRPPSSDSYSRG